MFEKELNEKGIFLKSYEKGKHDSTCPFCSKGRKEIHKKQKIFRVWIEDNIATYNCVHCGEHGWVLKERAKSVKPNYVRPDVKPLDNLGAKAEAFFKNRGLSSQNAKELGIYVDTKKFGKPVMAYPYFKYGTVVNVKYRGIDEKCFFQEKDCEPVLYNYDNCLGCREVIIVEGENDVLAFREVGIKNVVSIPAGSINKEIPLDQESSKFDFLKNSQPLFDSCDKIILALDSDEAGQAMTKALVDRIGRSKCWFVDWTVYQVEGKDANDFLKQDRNILQDAINNAKPVPLRGIVRAGDDMDDFEEYLRTGTKNAISTGYDNLDQFIKFEYGNFITVTGFPGSGKSNFATSLVYNLAKNYGIKSLFCAFENSPNQLKKRWGQMILGKPTTNADEDTINELRQHYDFMNEHFYILQDFTTTLTVDNILEMAEQAILQNGIKCMIIDPLNKIEFSKSKNLTEDIGTMLNKLICFAKKYKILMFLVAHPTKPSERGKLGSQNVPSGFDISGSANFLNMSDIVMTVHRKQDEYGNKGKKARVLISKVRDTDYGHEGSCYFHYDTYAGCYNQTTKEDFEAEEVGKTKLSI